MAQYFLAPKAYTPGGNDLVNTLQNEDVLTGNVAAGATSLTGDIGNPNDSGGTIIAPTITGVETINIAFTSTNNNMTLDFQDISGTDTANITRISADLRQSFTNLSAEVATLGISNTSEQAKATITYLNNELAANNNAVTLNLDNASLSGTVGDGAALRIEATTARGSDLQHQIETYNVNAVGSASTVATFATGVSSFDDLVVGERPQTINIDADASLAIGTLRWLGNRVETNSANAFQVVAVAGALHQVDTNGLGFVNFDQINTITVTGASAVTLANVGTWETEVDTDADFDFTLDASTMTGNLTADISNAAMSSDAVFTGGLGSDRFYAAGSADSAGTPLAVSVVAEINGGDDGVDTLTVQSNAGGEINLVAGSAGMDVLNAVQGIGTGAPATWDIDLADGGFTEVTFNNQDTANAMINVLTGLNAATQSLSIRSTGLNAVGDPATTAQDEVTLTFTQAAGLVGGTLSLELGHATDDRADTDAFSHRNHTSTVSLADLGAQGTTEVASLDLVLNSAGASGTGAAQINVVNDDFETLTTLTSQVGATNVVNIGWQQDAGESDYTAAGTNGLNSTTYNGSAYLGTQNVTFGSASANQGVVKSHVISTGTANNDTVDLSYMGTNAARTSAAFAVSSFLLGTEIDLGGGTGDELILSATLADPRVVLNADITYDGYFQNWNNVDVLTINNRNSLGVSGGTNTQALTNAYVGLDAYAQINNSGLNVINFNDVSGELAVGFRFTNNLTINSDATGAVGLERATKWTTLNSFSEANNTINVVAFDGIDGVAGVGNLVQYTNTGANLLNTVTLNYTGFSNVGATLDSIIDGGSLVVQNGSLDVVTFSGDLGLDDQTNAVGNLTVTTDQAWTAASQTTTYDFSGIINTTGGTGLANAVITFDATNETDATGLTILGSTDGGSATLGVNNTITGSSGADTITSAGYEDSLVGGAGADTITYTGSAGVASNGVTVEGGEGNDTITLAGMQALELSRVVAGAGNDTVSLSLGTTTYSFADTAVDALVSLDSSTVSEMVNNVGLDSISGINVATAAGQDIIEIDILAFGTDIDNAGGVANFLLVGTSAVTFDTAADANMLIAVQTGTTDANAGTSASLFYVQNTGLLGIAGTSINNLIQNGDAIQIGQFTSVTGLFSGADFIVV